MQAKQLNDKINIGENVSKEKSSHDTVSRTELDVQINEKLEKAIDDLIARRQITFISNLLPME